MSFSIGKCNSSLALLPMLAMQFVNIPYIFGGKSALIGLDCSGLVCELLGAVGVIPRNAEYSSQELYDLLKTKSVDGEIALGAVAFYGADIKNIHHVGMLLDINFIIEAAHGDSTTTTLDEAQKKNAKSRVSRLNYRSDLVAVLRPRYVEFDLTE